MPDEKGKLSGEEEAELAAMNANRSEQRADSRASQPGTPDRTNGGDPADRSLDELLHSQALKRRRRTRSYHCLDEWMFDMTYHPEDDDSDDWLFLG